MEDACGGGALGHTVDKGLTQRSLRVVGGEYEGGQPQAKRPGRAAAPDDRKVGIAVQHVFRGRAVGDESIPDASSRR